MSVALNREDAKACIGPGWRELIDKFYNFLEANPERYKDVSVGQVKEKFGTLRIYFSGGDDFLEGIVWSLGWFSGMICEDCGKRGRVNTSRGWYLTQCKDHWDGPEEWHVNAKEEEE